MPPRFRRLAVSALAGTLALTGCGTPPWEEPPAAAPVITPSTSPTPTVAPTPTPVRIVVNELAGGSTEHAVTAGAVQLTARYWSTLGMDKWVATANKPVSLSVSATLNGDQGQRVYLSRVALDVQVEGPGGTLPGPATVVDQASISPGYQVKSPYSYGQTFVLPEMDPTAIGVVLRITYDVLVQTTPRSTEYAKQSAVDTLSIAFAP